MMPFDPFRSRSATRVGGRNLRGGVTDEPEVVPSVRELVHDMLVSVCDDRMLLPEAAASQGGVGFYVDRFFGEDRRQFGATPPEPLLRLLVEHGDRLGPSSSAIALCAAALGRLTADDNAIALVKSLVDPVRGSMPNGRWPVWIDQPPAVPMAAWAAYRGDGRLDAVVTEWCDSDGVPHAFGSIGLGDEYPGSAPHALVLGATGDEIVTTFETPVDDDETPMSFERVTLGQARQLLSDSIDDVRMLRGELLAGDLPLPILAFLERRRDLLE